MKQKNLNNNDAFVTICFGNLIILFMHFAPTAIVIATQTFDKAKLLNEYFTTDIWVRRAYMAGI